MTWQGIERALIRTELDYSRQGSYSDASEYPPSFFTFWQPSTIEGEYYDNESNSTIWTWYVYYYTNDPSTLYTKMDEFIGYAKEEGFIVEGRGRDIRSDRADYPGRMITLKYIERH